MLLRVDHLEDDRMDDLVTLYVDLLEHTLTGAISEEPGHTPSLMPVIPLPYNEKARLFGTDWPLRSMTMIGLTRIRHLGQVVRRVIAERIPGDLIETGVWRGGACIYMRAMLAVLGDMERRVWVADSFAGLPPPDPAHFPADAGDLLHRVQFLRVSLDQVKANFARFNMLDGRVRFLPGWFKDTLPTAPIERLAILRLDGDMYESTINALDALYDKVSPGGFVIIDDYNALPSCKQAIQDFRGRHGITSMLEPIDNLAAFWRVAT
jgi:O-methyltransferase